MTSAIFDTKPEKVLITEISDKVYVQLRLNPEKITVEDEDGVKSTAWKCDFHEFHAPVGYFDVSDIKKHPENYTETEPFDEDVTNDRKKTTPEIVVQNTKDIGDLRADLDYLMMLSGEE